VLAAGRAVKHLYVHVVKDNEPALLLYTSCGFQVESEESVDAARKRQHGRRVLLWKMLDGSPEQ
jgi:ribosomal protein S18 acetylase RimI-like enzyme